MEDNSYINSLVNEIKDEVDLAWEETQNGGDNETKEEARIAYNYLNTLLIEIERDKQYNYMVSSQDMMGVQDDNN